MFQRFNENRYTTSSPTAVRRRSLMGVFNGLADFGQDDENVVVAVDEQPAQPPAPLDAAMQRALWELSPLENVPLGEDETMDIEEVLSPAVIKYHVTTNFMPWDKDGRRYWIFVKNPRTWQRYKTYTDVFGKKRKVKGPISSDRQRKWKARAEGKAKTTDAVYKSAFAKTLTGAPMTLAEMVIVASAIAKVKRKRKKKAHRRRVIKYTAIAVIGAAAIAALVIPGVFIAGSAVVGPWAGGGGAAAAGSAAKVAGGEAGKTVAKAAIGPELTDTLPGAGSTSTQIIPTPESPSLLEKAGETALTTTAKEAAQQVTTKKEEEKSIWENPNLYKYAAGAVAAGAGASMLIPKEKEELPSETVAPEAGYSYYAPLLGDKSKLPWIIGGGVAVLALGYILLRKKK